MDHSEEEYQYKEDQFTRRRFVSENTVQKSR